MQTNRTNIAITPAEAAELSGALFSSGSAAAHELAPIFADIASGRLTSVELMLAGSQPGSAAEPIVIDGLSIDLASRTVKVLGVPASLTPKEFDILAFWPPIGARSLARKKSIERCGGTSICSTTATSWPLSERFERRSSPSLTTRATC